MIITFNGMLITLNLDLDLRTRARVCTSDDKGLEIYTAGLEFESERASLIRIWDRRCFTRSPGSTKCIFREVGFSRIKKKIHLIFIYNFYKYILIIYFSNKLK
jgi:hypothetical protein